MSDHDLLTCPGGHLKALGEHVVGGFCAIFTDSSSPDREGDFFTNETDFDLEDRQSIKSFWHHKLDKTVPHSLGRALFQLRPDHGLWAELKLKSDATGQRIFSLAERGELAWSSGSSAHLVRRELVGDSHWIREWPISEISILPTDAAAEPRAKVAALKSLVDGYAAPLMNSDCEQQAVGLMVANEMRRLDLTSPFSFHEQLAEAALEIHESRMSRLR